MTPESLPSPAMPGTAAESYHAALQRGKGLVVAAMIVTCLTAVEGVIRRAFADGISGHAPGELIGLALVGWLCWRCFQGGPVAKGCLAILCFPMMVALPFIGLLLISKTLNPLGPGSLSIDDFHDIGTNWRSTLAFLPAFGSSVFTFWVLAGSKDAGLYLRVCRSGLSEAEALPYERERAHRRQEHFFDAP